MKKVLSLILAVMLLLSLCACGTSENSENKQQDYETASRYMKQGKYEEAIDAFNALGNYKDSKDMAKYCEAQSYCYIGDYRTAYDLLVQIPNVEGVKPLLREIFFETRLFEGLADLRTSLKNPDSLTVTSIQFTYYVASGGSNKNAPPCILTVSGQNGFGGYSTSYVLLTEGDNNNGYICLGSCRSLTENTNSDSEALTAIMINLYLADNNTRIENPVNIDRVNNIIKLQKYSSITRIAEQSYLDIEY